MFTICAYALDFGFTYVYRNSSPQNKVQYISSLKNQKLDYIFIGSSRVENSVIPEIIEEKTKKRTINLGVQGATIKDLVFITKLLNDLNISYKKVFFQLDYKINDVDQYSKKFQTELYPFIGINELIDNYVFDNNLNKFELKYLPFYKYNIASQNLGFRNIMLTVLKIKKTVHKSQGYMPLNGSEKMTFEILPKYNSNNKYLTELLKTKKASFFSCPLFSTISKNNYFDDLKNTITDFKDLSSSVVKKELFKDSYHLNNDGAIVFTNILIDKLKL
ncbi:hypothetical protein [Flavobacterium urocaniciphilum]|uniref:SGNH/GDSL hydrolase family protein n=1 Tax=Flavobacterium urocaniciphilum TaxID=1299341 RepID=A0A1H8YRZ9_9FLAO|nr:hypothetical protein [Flavobacterium urocaniciphilum]SEP54917.1 hypothetical protein SAMN05444005_10189 [Flavobacterium urocaniciphilum]